MIVYEARTLQFSDIDQTVQHAPNSVLAVTEKKKITLHKKAMLKWISLFSFD